MYHKLLFNILITYIMAANWSGLVNLCLGHNRNNLLGTKARISQLTKITEPATSTKPTMRYMPTYRLDPVRPLNKEACEKIMKAVMDKTFTDFTYSPKTSMNVCAQVSEEIKNLIKSQNYDRYRYIVIVSVGEKLMQGYCSLVNFLWDAENDGFLSYVVDTPKFFAIATLYYIYYD